MTTLMQAKLTCDGNLELKRNQSFVLQWCPYAPTHQYCCDKCPLLHEVYDASGNTISLKLLCSIPTTVHLIHDGRLTK